MSEIPSELHLEILKLLPAHHLFPLRLVCKEWRSIVDALVDPPSLLILPSPPIDKSYDYTPLIHPACKNPQTGSEIYSLPLHSLDSSSDNTSEELCDGIINLSSINTLIHVPEFPLPRCDGHILIPSSPDKYWTLSFNGSSDVHSIPPYDPFAPHEYEAMPGKNQYTAYFGLGYDASTSDYKVVRVARILAGEPSDPYCDPWDFSDTEKEIVDPYLFKTSIYSLKSQSWRSIEDFPRVNTLGFHSFHDEGFHPGGVFLHGALHWFAGVDYIENIQEDLEDNQYSIVALDLSSETYRKLPLPQCKSVLPSMTKYLDVLGGYLFLSCSEHCLKSVWILKDYGGENKWSQLASFQPINFDYDNKPMRPVAYVKSKEQVVFHYDWNKLMWVDVEKEELLKKIIIKDFEEHGFTCQQIPASLAWFNGTHPAADESIALNRMAVNKRKRADVKFKISVCKRPKLWTRLASSFTVIMLN